jgi:hypothetical protein
VKFVVGCTNINCSPPAHLDGILAIGNMLSGSATEIMH